VCVIGLEYTLVAWSVLEWLGVCVRDSVCVYVSERFGVVVNGLQCALVS
jgi:hypothetical protein